MAVDPNMDVHGQMVGNLIRALVAVEGERIVLSPGTKVRVPGRESVCPDVVVVRHLPELVGDALANPQVIVEVLSDESELADRGEKYRWYLSLPSVVDYVLVTHRRVRVEHYTRGPDETWVLREHGAGSRLRLRMGEIAVDDIYREVSLAEPHG